MRKITLVIALLYSISAFPTRYLVQGTGTNTWRTAGTGEVNVTLTTTLKAWYEGQAMLAGDEVWLAAGTYNVIAAITMKADVSLYGSFAGNELTTAERSKISGGNPWDFTSQTILDGNSTNTQGLLTTISVNSTYFDGLKITNFHKLPGTAATYGVGASLLKNCIMQNCIVSNNSFIGVSGNANGCNGAGVSIKDGHLLNSYIHHNECSKGTGAAAASAGGIILWGSIASATVPIISVVKGCTIESNTAVSGGGLLIGEDWGTRHTGGIIEDCIFKSNTATAGNGGGFHSAGYSRSADLTIKNCQFIENRATSGSPTSGFGAGAHVHQAGATVKIEGCSFIGNIASPPTNGFSDGGGGLHCADGIFSPIKNCIFRDNKISSTANGSAISCKKQITLQNCVIANNTSVAANFSTIVFQIAGSKLLNSTIAQNVTSGTGRAVEFIGRAVEVSNCIFWGNSMNTSSNFNAFDLITGSNNAFDTKDPVISKFTGCITSLTSSNTFLSPTTFKGVPTDDTQKAASVAANWQLQKSAPAVDAGTNLTASGITTDLLGAARPTGMAYDMGAYECANVSATSGLGLTAASDLIVPTGEILNIDVPTTINSITIEKGGKVTNTSTLTVSNFTINSDADVMGTYVDNGKTIITGTASVNKTLSGLTGTSARPWWYISSPVSGATAGLFNVEAGTNKMTYYDETIPGYAPQLSSNETVLERGKGYVAYLGGGDATYTFTGDSLYSGTMTLTPTRTGYSAAKRGFNLVGNPYPSFLNWNAVSKTNVRPTIWYRTHTGSQMQFDTFDGTIGTGNGINGVVSQNIPPMQAFWVKVDADSSTGSLVLNNSMRLHKDQRIATSRLRSATFSDPQILRLKVTNGMNGDEAIVVANPNASDDYDSYDSPKMTNANAVIPEIYTLAGNEETVINYINSISPNKELALGFRAGVSDTFTIKATQLTNFDTDTKIILKDNVLNTENDITDGTPYSFSSDIADDATRFTIVFKSASGTTGIDNYGYDNSKVDAMIVYKNAINQIVVNRKKTNDQEGTLTVYSVIGQKMLETPTTGTSTIINKQLASGVYLVTLSVAGKKLTKKVIIN